VKEHSKRKSELYKMASKRVASDKNLLILPYVSYFMQVERSASTFPSLEEEDDGDSDL
jgi:hypothetical protein